MLFEGFHSTRSFPRAFQVVAAMKKMWVPVDYVFVVCCRGIPDWHLDRQTRVWTNSTTLRCAFAPFLLVYFYLGKDIGGAAHSLGEASI